MNAKVVRRWLVLCRRVVRSSHKANAMSTWTLPLSSRFHRSAMISSSSRCATARSGGESSGRQSLSTRSPRLVRVSRQGGARLGRGGHARRGRGHDVTADEYRRRRRGTEEGRRPPLRLTQHDRYKIKKYWRTNQDTAINQRPMVRVGQRVARSEVLADGAATEFGQLALGANVRVAFMPWYGHNFEDAIVLSERLVRRTFIRHQHPELG